MTAPATLPPTSAAESDLQSPGPRIPPADFGPTDRFRGWVMTAVITAIAALTRFINLGALTDRGTPVFDEKHYVPQGWQVVTNNGVEDNPGYGLVVHPPIGKQMIAIGEWLFGYDPFGWRFAATLSGTILVLLVARIARRISRSTMVGAIAGVLLIADGVSFVTARTALLDVYQALFVVAAFGALIVDRDQVRQRLYNAYPRGASATRRGARAWVCAGGVSGPASCSDWPAAPEWSGLYFIAFFGVLCIAFDIAARRAYGVPRPWAGAAVRDLGPALYALLIIPFLVYMASYWSWFASETGINRHAEGRQIGVGGWMPDALRSLWYYTHSVYTFHSTLTNSNGNHHPWESKPWTWPMSLRPLLYAIEDKNIPGCGANSCVRAVLLVGTPAIWWLAVPVLLWATWATVVRRDWRYAAALVGYCAGGCPGSRTSTGRCTSSTPRPWCRSW